MPLILCVKKGKPFFVGNKAIFIKEIISEINFIVSVDKISHCLTKSTFVEILPNVMASCGETCPKGFVKIVLVAPKHIVIARERIFKQRKRAEYNLYINQKDRIKNGE